MWPWFNAGNLRFSATQQVIFNCEFGTESNPDDCGLVQLPDGREDRDGTDVDWSFNSGSTGSQNTGPDRDTSGRQDGEF